MSTDPSNATLPPGVQDPPPLPLSPTWNRLLDDLATRFPLVDRSPHTLRFAAGPEEQALSVHLLHAHGRMRMLLTAEIGALDAVSLREALELGAGLLLGGMIVDGETLALRHVLTEGRFAEAAVGDIARRLRAIAARARKQLLHPVANDGSRPHSLFGL